MYFDKEEFIRVYDELKSSRKVAEYFNTTKTTVLKYAKEIGYDNSRYNTFKEETGKRYGKLLVLERIGNDAYNRARYRCLCDCGNITEVLGAHLRGGNTKSCGCLRYEFGTQNKKDETGNKYGLLTVLEEHPERTNSRQIQWKCKCECGNIVIDQGNHLRSGHTTSCGCIKSKGERYIADFLKAHNIGFSSQQTFQDLLSPEGFNLFFDFAICDEHRKITHFIEYDGEQHFKEVEGWNIQPLSYRQQCDRIKNEFAKKYNIPLLRIPYTLFNDIDTLLIEFLHLII